MIPRYSNHKKISKSNPAHDLYFPPLDICLNPYVEIKVETEIPDYNSTSLKYRYHVTDYYKSFNLNNSFIL